MHPLAVGGRHAPQKVYENALMMELRKSRLKVLQQMPIEVCYEGHPVGEYFADLLVEDKVIVEVKALESIIKAHEHQPVNYLRATSVEVGLILDFGPEPQFKRKIFSDAWKLPLRTHTARPNSLQKVNPCESA